MKSWEKVEKWKQENEDEKNQIEVEWKKSARNYFDLRIKPRKGNRKARWRWRLKTRKYERACHINAFNIYLKLGPLRSFGAVAKVQGVSPDTIEDWAKIFVWNKRIEKKEKELATALACPDLVAIQEMRQRHLKVARKTIEKYETNIPRLPIGTEAALTMMDKEAELLGDRKPEAATARPQVLDPVLLELRQLRIGFMPKDAAGGNVGSPAPIPADTNLSPEPVDGVVVKPKDD